MVMNRKLRTLLATLAIAVSASSFGRLPIEIEGLTIASRELGRDVSYSLVIPAQASAERPCRVLYMLHGIGGDASSWMEYANVGRKMQAMADSGLIEPCIIVMPDGYMSYYADAADGSLNYEGFFINELIPAVDSLLPTIADRNHRSIAGFSMGGFGALSLGLRNRDKFESIEALSPSIRTDAQFCTEMPQQDFDHQWGRTFGAAGLEGSTRLTNYYRARSPRHIIDTLDFKELASMRILIDTGDDESTLAPAIDELHAHLLKRGIKHRYIIRQGGHDFDCWYAALPGVLRYAAPLGSKAKPFVRTEHSDPKPISIARSIVYLPKQDVQSTRKYPTVYLSGSFSAKEQADLAGRCFSMQDKGTIRPMALCFLAKDSLPESVEKHMPQLRSSQRMRALVAKSADAKSLLKHLATSNRYTSIVLTNPNLNAEKCPDIAQAAASYSRYPRFIIATVGNESFNGASALRHSLSELRLKHSVTASSDESNVFNQWEQWLMALDSRIHI